MKKYLLVGFVLFSNCAFALLEDEEARKKINEMQSQLNNIEKSLEFKINQKLIAGIRPQALKISDKGIRERDEIVTKNFFSKGIPLCGVLGGGYNKDFNKLVELHSFLHQSCAKLI